MTNQQPSNGDKLFIEDSVVGTFTGETSPCKCGGMAYEFTDGIDVGSAMLCSDLMRIHDDGYIVLEDRVAFFKSFLLRRQIAGLEKELSKLNY